MTYISLEEVTTAFQTASAVESDSKFVQGEVLVHAVEDGLSKADVLKACGDATGKSRSTINDRFRVEKIFPAHKRAKHLDWSLHRLCTTDVDVDDERTYAAAYQWLEVAAAGRMINDTWRPHSYASLKAVMTASGSNPDAGDPIYLLDNVPAYVAQVTSYPNGKTAVELVFDTACPLCGLTDVLVTIVKPAVQTSIQKAA